MMRLGVGGEFRWGFGEFGVKVLKWNSWQIEQRGHLASGNEQPRSFQILHNTIEGHTLASTPSHTHRTCPSWLACFHKWSYPPWCFWWFCQILKLISMCFWRSFVLITMQQPANGINNHTCKLCRPVRIYPAAPSLCRNVVCVWICNVKGKIWIQRWRPSPFHSYESCSGPPEAKNAGHPEFGIVGRFAGSLVKCPEIHIRVKISCWNLLKMNHLLN